MANIFYSASGNPATGAQGLSALVRAEFVSIQTAFDLVPPFTSTGAFQTIFGQQGNFTFTLPAEVGTLALLTDVSTAVTVETTRATTAEGVNAAAVTAEATRATTAEGVNAAAVAAETARAEAAEASFALFATVHNVLSSRVLGTAYTNTTGRPMFFSAVIGFTSSTNFLLLTINGLLVDQYGLGGSSSGQGSVSGIVPIAGTYTASGSGSGFVLLNCTETW
jgi:hypothetical protein